MKFLKILIIVSIFLLALQSLAVIAIEAEEGQRDRLENDYDWMLNQVSPLDKAVEEIISEIYSTIYNDLPVEDLQEEASDILDELDFLINRAEANAMEASDADYRPLVTKFNTLAKEFSRMRGVLKPAMDDLAQYIADQEPKTPEEELQEQLDAMTALYDKEVVNLEGLKEDLDVVCSEQEATDIEDALTDSLTRAQNLGTEAANLAMDNEADFPRLAGALRELSTDFETLAVDIQDVLDTPTVIVSCSTPLEDRYNYLRAEFNKLDDKYDDYRRKYNRAVDNDDKQNIDRYEDKLQDLRDDLKDLEDDVEDLIDDLTSGTLKDKAEDLEDDITDLIKDIKDLLEDEVDFGDERNDFQSRQQTSAAPRETVDFGYLTGNVVVPSTPPVSSTEPASGIPLVWLIVGVVVLVALIVFLLAVLLM